MQKLRAKKIQHIIIYLLVFNFQLIIFKDKIFSQVYSESGTTAAGFLKIPVGARATSMGGYYSMYGNDVSLLYWNPSGISGIQSSNIEFSHKEYFQGIKHDFLGYVNPIKSSVIGFGITTFFVDGIEGRSGVLDMDDAYVNLYQVSPVEYYFGILDLAVIATYSRKVNKRLSLGINTKFVSQKIDNYIGYGFGIDLGSNIMLNKNLFLGAVIKNLGTQIKLDKEGYNLPLEIGTGLWYKYKNTNFVFNLTQHVDNFLISNIGIEQNVLENIFLRAGYKYRLYGWELGNDTGLSAGIGFNFYGIKMDYGLSSYGVLGYVHSVSIGIDFFEINNSYKSIRKKLSLVSTKKEDKKEETRPNLPEEKKVETLKPIAINPVNEKVYTEVGQKHYNIKTKNKILSYDSFNKIYLYNFSTLEPIVLEEEKNKKLVLEKVEGKFSSRKKYNGEESNLIVTSSSIDGLRAHLPEGQKVVKMITIQNYLEPEVSRLSLYFSQKNYNKPQFYVIDKNLQKLEPEVFYKENGFLYKINISNNYKILVTEEEKVKVK